MSTIFRKKQDAAKRTCGVLFGPAGEASGADPFLHAGLLIAAVADPEKDVHRHHDGVDDVKDKGQVVVVVHDFGGDAAEVSKEDEAAEKQALSSGGPAAVHARDGERPGDPEAQNH